MKRMRMKRRMRQLAEPPEVLLSPGSQRAQLACPRRRYRRYHIRHLPQSLVWQYCPWCPTQQPSALPFS